MTTAYIDHSIDKTATGIFVGDTLSFSDTVLRLAGAELPCLQFSRAPSLASSLAMSKAEALAVRMIIVEESMLDEVIAQMPLIRRKFVHANIALAFRRTEIGLRLLEGRRTMPELQKVGFLPMDLDVDSWLSLLRLLVNGGCFVPANLMAHRPRTPMPEAPDAPDPVPAGQIHLTERELEVLEAASAGKQNKIIAEQLKVSQHTVKLHMHHIIAKLGVHNRTEAAVWYLNRQG